MLILRRILAVLAGLFTAMLVVILIETLSRRVYPPPPGIDLTDPAQLEAFFQGLSPGALGMILAAWTLGTLAGALVACRIGPDRPLIFASIIGAIMLVATMVNLAAIPHSDGFGIAAIALVTGAALLASRLSSTPRRRSRAV